jgi:hypothetical protein
MHHALELLPLWSEEQDPRFSTLLVQGAVEEERTVRLSEDRSLGFQLAIIRAPGLHGGGVQSTMKLANA